MVLVPGGHVTTSTDILGCHDGGGEGAAGIWGEGAGAGGGEVLRTRAGLAVAPESPVGRLGFVPRASRGPQTEDSRPQMSVAPRLGNPAPDESSSRAPRG